MVEIADIKDRESLQAWLKNQPQEVSIWVAHRSAMRVLPSWWDSVLKRRDGQIGLRAVRVLWCNIISGVARTKSSSDISIAAEAAYAFSPSNASSAASRGGVYTVFSPGSDFASGAGSTASHAADVAANSVLNPDIHAAYWELIREDCKLINSKAELDRSKLWGKTVIPLTDVWGHVKQLLMTSNPSRSSETALRTVKIDWSFWIKWYDDALNGTPPNWDMLERIALIDPEEWDKGAEVVNPLIAEIVAEYEGKTNALKDFQPTPVSPAAKTAIVERVQQNREVLALSIAGVLEQISEFRERIRRINDLDQAQRENAFEFLDGLSAQLADLLAQLPDADQVVEEAQADRLVTWGQQFRHSFVGKAKEYAAPENVAGAVVPTGIILGCSAIGAFFGPLGVGAGGVIGKLITGELKPAKAADALFESDDPSIDE